MEGLIQRLEGEMASGKREAIRIDRLGKVDFLQGLTEAEVINHLAQVIASRLM